MQTGGLGFVRNAAEIAQVIERPRFVARGVPTWEGQHGLRGLLAICPGVQRRPMPYAMCLQCCAQSLVTAGDCLCVLHLCVRSGVDRDTAHQCGRVSVRAVSGDQCGAIDTPGDVRELCQWWTVLHCQDLTNDQTMPADNPAQSLLQFRDCDHDLTQTTVRPVRVVHLLLSRSCCIATHDDASLCRLCMKVDSPNCLRAC